MADSYEINLEIQGGEQPALMMETEGGATDGASARNAEAWANGTRNGVPVEEGDPAYNKSSKYYRDSAAAIAAGDVIDDDAGAGDLMLTWSADKLVNEFNGKAPAIVVSDTTPEAVKSFSDGADGMPMGMVVGVEPVQDLHGYDSPWPAGGGKNLLDEDDSDYLGVEITSYGASDQKYLAQINNLPAGTYTLSFKVKVTNLNGAQAKQTNVGLYLRASHDGTNFNVDGQISTVPTVGTVLTKSITFTLPSEYVGEFKYFYTYTGKDVSVEPQIIYSGIIYDVQIESGSTATDYAPYSNVCPISGWTGAKVTRTGKNLLDPESRQNPTNNVRFYYGTDGLLLKANTTYTFSVSSPSAQIQIVKIGGSTIFTNFGKSSITFTPTKDVHVWLDAYYAGNYPAPSGGTAAVICQLEIGSTASAYEPYQGKTYQITFPQEAGTVYGGTLTENADGTGTLVVDRAIIDLGTRTWTYIQPTTSTPFGTFYNTILDKEYGQLNMICSAYPVKAGFSNDKAIQGNAGASTIYLQDSSFDGDAVALKTSLSGVQLVYELETPQTYTLSALEVIETLKGMNNLWADTGDIKAVDYPADTKLYIDGKIAELQAMILENISNS